MSDAEAIPAGKLAQIYIKIRTKRADLLKDYELADNELKESLETIEAEMLEKCKSDQADSIKTPFGTIIRTVKQRFWPADWEIFNQFVLDREALGLFEKRVHQTNMAIWLEEHPEDPPPGLNIDRKYSCSVRKASK